MKRNNLEMNETRIVFNENLKVDMLCEDDEVEVEKDDKDDDVECEESAAKKR